MLSLVPIRAAHLPYKMERQFSALFSAVLRMPGFEPQLYFQFQFSPDEHPGVTRQWHKELGPCHLLGKLN